jgi:hypothetical protein
MPLHLFRWLHRGHYADVAFLLHAVFLRPEGPPSRLIERVWDHLPEIERLPDEYRGWDVVRTPSSGRRTADDVLDRQSTEDRDGGGQGEAPGRPGV